MITRKDLISEVGQNERKHVKVLSILVVPTLQVVTGTMQQQNRSFPNTQFPILVLKKWGIRVVFEQSEMDKRLVDWVVDVAESCALKGPHDLAVVPFDCHTLERPLVHHVHFNSPHFVASFHSEPDDLID